ncbi:GNAT family N-acetyltransferase [Streptomyces sp. NPDC006475]|uniref:GNAT family N-acetyltransferase n=1 Tax=Streptomyces sp. NPDC006475 TaxID=3155719 RepID=UPI00339FD07D
MEELLSARGSVKGCWCMFFRQTHVGKEHRGTGVARELVRGAVSFARDNGARTVEAYPVDDTMGPVGADEAFHGLVSPLTAEGFSEVARRSPKRPVMWRQLT